MIISWQNLDRDTLVAVSPPVYLSIDENVSPQNGLHTDFTIENEGVLIKAVCEALYFPDQSNIMTISNNAVIRRKAQKRIDALRTSLLYSPPQVKELARGKAVAVNVNNNFGNLACYESSETLLSMCWLHDAQIIDGHTIEGVRMRLVFARVADACVP
jgi:hypothetical protein